MFVTVCILSMSNQVRDKTCQNITKREQNDQFKIVTQRDFELIINYGKVQPWWPGSLAHYLSHSVEEVHLAIGGSNPILVWCINHSEVETLCRNSKCRTPGHFRGLLYMP